jgi:hypothetical protein
MTLESLANKLVEYLSWLYYGRQWAIWELELIALTTLVLVLVIVRRRWKARARVADLEQFVQHGEINETQLTANNSNGHQTGELQVHHLPSFLKKDGKKKRWSRKAKDLRGVGALVEQLQIEVSRYKVAEEGFKQQLVKLKTANERLRRELDTGGARHSELPNGAPLARFTNQKDGTLEDR